MKIPPMIGVVAATAVFGAIVFGIDLDRKFDTDKPLLTNGCNPKLNPDC